jgi:Ca2+-binding EF-hand superfamily protein
VLTDFGIDVSEVDLKNIFKSFDIKTTGEIEYDEFTKILIGPMSPLRAGIVAKAFNKLDIN